MTDRPPPHTDPAPDPAERPPEPHVVHPSLFAVAAGLAVIGAVMLWDAGRLSGAAGYSNVGPAMFPRIIGGVLIGLAVWTAVSTLRRDFPDPHPSAHGPILWVLAGLTAQLLLLKVAGFSIATGLLFALTARGFGKRNLAVTIPLGIAMAFVIWAVFSQVLMLNLPAGPLERLFFGAAP